MHGWLRAAGAYFPGASAQLSTFDWFVANATADGALSALPTIERDLSDSWIWGAASDPLKLARLRAWQRQSEACVASGAAECSAATSPAASPFYNASRLALKGTEHTWGVSITHYGDEKDKHWSNAEFAPRRNTSENLRKMAASWEEQRR